MRAMLDVTVIGGGILGLWQAFELARRGQRVRLFEAMPEAETGAASRFAGAMLAPDCEGETAGPTLRALGHEGLRIWRQAFPDLSANGSLVVAASRDRRELTRFARLTAGHQAITADSLAGLEPLLAGRFTRGLYFSNEAHLEPRTMLARLVRGVAELGGELNFGRSIAEPVWRAVSAGGVVVDCRGLAAREILGDLRGVRGEMAVVRIDGPGLTRPVRLLHPRFPLYVVPWSNGRHMIGATMIESENAGPVTLRSALELLGSACALNPAFGDARIEEVSSSIRPAFPDNMPCVRVRGRHFIVNGAYRHGYLLAPVLAHAVADALIEDRIDSRLVFPE